MYNVSLLCIIELTYHENVYHDKQLLVETKQCLSVYKQELNILDQDTRHNNVMHLTITDIVTDC